MTRIVITLCIGRIQSTHTRNVVHHRPRSVVVPRRCLGRLFHFFGQVVCTLLNKCSKLINVCKINNVTYFCSGEKIANKKVCLDFDVLVVGVAKVGADNLQVLASVVGNDGGHGRCRCGHSRLVATLQLGWAKFVAKVLELVG